MKRADAALAALLLVTSTRSVTAQTVPSVTAFVNVNLLTMTDERVQVGQTVLVQDGRIGGIGPSSSVEIPAGAVVIDGAGRYLLPGLTDAHVHLETGMPWGQTRDDFGDAPIYLAYGVTTVMNLSGDDVQLGWRRRVESGEWLGPTIYSAGPFVNEPRVTTPEEVERDILAQAQAGFDLIKFHELPGTTRGLGVSSYRRMIEVARLAGLPLVGHAPVNLGLDEMLSAHQSIAHTGMLSNIYFMPFTSHLGTLFATLGSFVMLIVVAASGIVQMLFRRRTSRKLSTMLALTSVAAFATALMYLPGGPLFASTGLRVLFTALVALVAVAAAMAVWTALASVRDPLLSVSAKGQALVLAVSGGVLAVTLITFWVPVSWRSSDAGIESLAARLKGAGIFVQSTLIVYESLSAEGRTALTGDPAFDLLPPSTREAWRRLRPSAGAAPLFRLREFMQRVVGALHRHRVPIMAGTDAMGLPLVGPGSSLHRELQLLIESGMSPYEALRSATVVPAEFLGKRQEFGTVAPGRRADLLLVSGNPLEDVAALKKPLGVMVRGRWLPREELDALLQGLRSQN